MFDRADGELHMAISLLDIFKESSNPSLPLFVQVGFNRFDIVSYTEHKKGYCTILVAEEANNPAIAQPELPEPKKIA